MTLRWRASLNAKITWLAITTSLLMMALISTFVFFFQEETRYYYHGNYAKTLAKVVREVYKNPHPLRVAYIAESSGIDLRYRGPLFEYVSNEDMPTFEKVTTLRRQPDGIAIASGNQRLVALHRNGMHQIMLYLDDDDRMWDTASWTWIFALLLLALLWIGFYFMQRRMLMPLHKLRNAMEAVGGGKWGEADIRRSDEIGELAAMFNRMQHRLRALIRAKERFLADASHELRSPLARLRLAAEFVEDKSLQEKMKADITELDGLTSSILEKTKLDSFSESLKKTPRAVKEIIAPLREKYPQAEFICNSDAVVECDIDALTRAFKNLLDNAIKFAVAKVSVRCEDRGSVVHIIIEDDGPGVPNADIPHLFEPFYRTDSSRSRDTGGHGLGLSIVHATVLAHGGAISARNNSPRGLRVEVRLSVY